MAGIRQIHSNLSTSKHFTPSVITMEFPDDAPLPPRFAELKKEIASSIPDFEARITKAWAEITAQLKVVNEDVAKNGPEVSYRDEMRRCTGC